MAEPAVGPAPWRPSRGQLEAARDRTVPDVIAPGLRVLFSGINPSLYSAAVGHHFARPGNRFWPVLHASGLTERVLSPFEDALLLQRRLGCTNLVGRATARADELGDDELRSGALALRERLVEYRPEWLALLGLSVYRAAFGARGARPGPQPELIGETRVWLLPNPSGLNAHYQLAELAAEYRALRVAAGL